MASVPKKQYQEFDQQRGARITQAMVDNDLHFNCEICYDIGVTESTLSRWRSGHPISLLNLIDLCHLLNVQIEWLIFGEPAPVPEASKLMMDQFKKLNALNRGLVIRLLQSLNHGNTRPQR